MIARIAAVAVVLATLGGIAAGCQEHEAPPPPPPDVVVGMVEQKDVPVHSEWVGTTDGSINAQIRARVQGYLQAQDYSEGRLVRKGDLLFTIDPRPYKAALDEANGQLARVQARFGKTQQDVARYTPLAREGAVSQEELDNSIQANLAARAEVESARATVEQAKLNLDWTRVTAPIDGIAGISVAQIGDLISENSVLTTVSQVDPIKVSFPISEQEYLRYAAVIQAFEPADQRHQRGNLELILADGNVFPQKGTASIANRQVDVKTGTMMIVSQFPNPDALLRPGQYAKVRVAVETKRSALLVPQLAVQEIQGAYQVAVVDGDNKVSMRRVKAAERVGDRWIIDEGLKPGERVVVEGLQKVRDGVIVNPKPAEPVASK